MTKEDQQKLLKEAEYKEQLADDLARVGAWQANLMREAAQRCRETSSL